MMPLSFHYLFIQHLKNGNVCSTPAQVALTAVTDVIKESVLFIFIYCFFKVGSVKFLQLSFCDFCLGEIDSVSVCKRGMRTSVVMPLRLIQATTNRFLHPKRL